MQLTRAESKFASAMATSLVGRRKQRTVLGKQHVKAAGLLGMCVYLFLQSGLLGRTFRSSPVPFVVAFFAPEDNGEEAAAAVRRSASEHVLPYLERVSNGYELVCAIEMDREGDHGEWRHWFWRHALVRVPIAQSVRLACQYQVEGAGFGMEHPERLEALFKSTCTIETAEDWHRTCEFGMLDICPEWGFLSMEDSARTAVEAFREYCKESYQQLLQPLGLGE